MIGATGRPAIGDVEVESFVDLNVVSFAAWDLIAFLSQHPEESFSLEDISRLLSRTPDDIGPVLERLTKSGLLAESKRPDMTSYRLTADASQRNVMSRFVAMSTRREYRLEFVRRVLAQITGG